MVGSFGARKNLIAMFQVNRIWPCAESGIWPVQKTGEKHPLIRARIREAKQDFHNRLFGRDHAHREAFRQRVLSVSLDDLRRVAETYLAPERASIAVITSHNGLDGAGDLVERLGLRVEEL